MGCDIHMYIEKKKNGKWIPAQGFMQTGNRENDVPDVPFHDQFNQRNYALFGFLAGVRIPELKHFEPQGFPDDASKEVKDVYNEWGTDAHTPSYLLLKELQTIPWDDLIDYPDYYEKPAKLRDAFSEFYDLVYWLNSYDYTCNPDEIRIVFWFDN